MGDGTIRKQSHWSENEVMSASSRLGSLAIEKMGWGHVVKKGTKGSRIDWMWLQ